MKSRSRRLAEFIAPPLLLFVVVLLLWHAGVRHFDLKPFQLPVPFAVFDEGRANARDLGIATLLTGSVAALGFVCSLILGVVIAFFFAQSVLIQRAFYPYAIFLQTIPVVAVAPLIIQWCGPGYASIVVTSTILSLFPVITNATTGLTATNANMEELFQLYGATRLQRLFKLQLPQSIPYIVAGAKIASGLSVIGAVIGEFFASFGGANSGLGVIIYMTSSQSKIAYCFAAIMCSTALGLAMFTAVSVIGGLLTRRWRMG